MRIFQNNVTVRYLSRLLTPENFLDYVIDVSLLLVLFAVIPVVLYFLPVIPDWILLLYSILMPILCLILVKGIYKGVLLKHKDTIIAAQNTRMQIRDTRRESRKLRGIYARTGMRICMVLNLMIQRLMRFMMKFLALRKKKMAALDGI